jgi:hypothetical protein
MLKIPICRFLLLFILAPLRLRPSCRKSCLSKCVVVFAEDFAIALKINPRQNKWHKTNQTWLKFQTNKGVNMSETKHGCRNETTLFTKHKRYEDLLWMNEQTDKLNNFSYNVIQLKSLCSALAERFIVKNVKLEKKSTRIYSSRMNFRASSRKIKKKRIHIAFHYSCDISWFKISIAAHIKRNFYGTNCTWKEITSLCANLVHTKINSL